MTKSLFLICLLLTGAAGAADLQVAVAANFEPCLEELAPVFAAVSGHRLTVIVGSTGHHHAQIVSGAPFDVFLAADTRRPADLEQRGLAVPGSRFTYARGQLVLWWPEPPPAVGADLCSVLASPGLRHLAVANPATAPYGAAAMQVLEGCAPARCPEVVSGRSVGQVWQFVASGNAEAGFVARSQLVGRESGLILTADPGTHDPIDQQAVLLAGASEPDAARAFLAFLRGDDAAAVIASFGYTLPEDAGP